MRDLQERCLVKVFSSSSAFSSAVISQLNLPVIPLTWSRGMLKNVLKTRMDNINLGGIGVFFDPSLRQVAQDLVLKAADNPGDLICKGNEILRVIGKNNRILNVKDAKVIFGVSLVNKVLKESQES
jgi:hypothetical protein